MVQRTLGRRIREERLKLNLTQEKLAEDVNLSMAYIGQIERGERSLTLDNRNSASITVVVTYGDLNNKKTYTVNFVTSNGNTEQPDEPSNPDAPEGGDTGEVTE